MVRVLLNTPPSRAAVGQNPAALSEEALLEALARGDRELAGELCRRLAHVVVNALYRVLGQPDSDYDDLVQASFEQIVVSLCRGKFSRACTLSTWTGSLLLTGIIFI